MIDSARKGSLLVVFLTVFIDLLGFGMVLPLLPLYGKFFAAQAGVTGARVGLLVGLLMASFSMMQFLFAPVWGRISDRVGRRPVILIGLGGSVVFYAMFGLATATGSVLWLFVSRIGAGMAGATISTAHAYIADSTTVATRTRGMALVGAAFGLGFTFGPLFGFLALWGAENKPGAAPGYAAAALSAAALLLATIKLPESLDLSQHTKAKKRRLLDFRGLLTALSTPSVGSLLLVSFLCVFAFANFESTLSLFLREIQERRAQLPTMKESLREICLMFAYVGFVLTVIQGGVVRRLAFRVSESRLITLGLAIEIGGFALLACSVGGSRSLILVALALVVTGFAFITPPMNALISRRSDPAKQGGVMGLTQSTSALARILGPVVGATVFHVRSAGASAAWPFWLAAALMLVSLLLLGYAVRAGGDYAVEERQGRGPKRD